MRSLCVVLALLAGCSKSREPAPALAQVPAGTALVATLSLEKLRASSHWPRLEAALAAKVPVAEVEKSCGITPAKSIRSLTVTTPVDLEPRETLVFVRGVSRDAAASCAKSFAASQNQTLTVTDEGKLAVYQQGEDTMYAAWLDATTAVLAPGDLTAKDRLQKLDAPAKHSAPFAEALAKLRTDRVIAFAFHAPQKTPMAHFLGVSGIHPESGHGWIDLDTTLRAEVVCRFATAEDAVAATKQTYVGPLAKLKSTQRDREVVFTLELDAAETAQVVDQLSAAAN